MSVISGGNWKLLDRDDEETPVYMLDAENGQETVSRSPETERPAKPSNPEYPGLERFYQLKENVGPCYICALGCDTFQHGRTTIRMHYQCWRRATRD